MRRNPYMPPTRVLRLASASLTERQQTALADYAGAYTRAVEAIVKPQAREQASRMGLRALGPDDTLPTPPVDYTDALARAADTGSRVVAMGERAGESRERQLAASGRAVAVSLLNSGVPRDLVAEWAADPETHRLVGIDDPREAAGWAVAVGVTFAGMTGPTAVEEGTDDDFADLMDAVRGMERQHKTYTYDGLSFKIGSALEEGMLWFRHALGSYRPVIFTDVRADGRVVRGRELEVDGWGREQSVVGRVVLDGSLRGNQLGIAPPGAKGVPLGLDDDPIPYLTRYQARLQEDRRRKEAEKAAEARRAAEETRKVGPWFVDVMEEAAKEAGWGESYVPDTVEAAVVRKVLAKYGIKASVKVRRYSMASGLDVSELDEQDAKDAAAIFPYTERAFRFGTGIYPHKREDRSDPYTDYHDPGGFRVAPQYVPVVKQIAVEELRKALAKSKAKVDPVADRENVPAKAEARPEPPKPRLVDAEAGDLIVRFGFYTGANVIDVVLVREGTAGVKRKSDPDQTVRVLESDTFRRQRGAWIDVTGAEEAGLAVSSRDQHDQAGRRIYGPAPDFTPRRIQRNPAAELHKVLRALNVSATRPIRVLWATAGAFSRTNTAARTSTVTGFLVPGRSMIEPVAGGAGAARRRPQRTATDADVKAVRALLRPIARQFGEKLSVKKGKGSVRGTVRVSTGFPAPEDPAFGIAVIDALMDAGYEDTIGNLAERRQRGVEYGQSNLSLYVAPLRS